MPCSSALLSVAHALPPHRLLQRVEDRLGQLLLHRGHVERVAAEQVEGRDYRVTAVRRGSGIAVIAPHGGRIERGTSEVARAIAGEDLDLYLFEGCLPSLNFETLHLTSRHFDEPRALGLIAAAVFWRWLPRRVT